LKTQHKTPKQWLLVPLTENIKETKNLLSVPTMAYVFRCNREDCFRCLQFFLLYHATMTSHKLKNTSDVPISNLFKKLKDRLLAVLLVMNCGWTSRLKRFRNKTVASICDNQTVGFCFGT